MCWKPRTRWWHGYIRSYRKLRTKATYRRDACNYTPLKKPPTTDCSSCWVSAYPRPFARPHHLMASGSRSAMTVYRLQSVDKQSNLCIAATQHIAMLMSGRLTNRIYARVFIGWMKSYSTYTSRPTFNHPSIHLRRLKQNTQNRFDKIKFKNGYFSTRGCIFVILTVCWFRAVLNNIYRYFYTTAGSITLMYCKFYTKTTLFNQKPQDCSAVKKKS